MANTLRKTKNSFEEYLTNHQISVPKDALQSSYFHYLIEADAKPSVVTRDVEQDATKQPNSRCTQQQEGRSSVGNRFVSPLNGTKMLRPTCLILGAIAQLSDDVARAAVPLTSTGLKFLSIAGIVVTIVLTPAVAAWTFYHSGERMNQQLHLLCDDLQVILVYLVTHICQQYSGDVKIPIRASAVRESSSSDED